MVEKPNLCLIPSAYKASKVYSVLPADGVGDFDFSRPTTATRINKDGFIETVGSNVPRLNYPLIDGVVSGCPSLLLEPERTNLIQYSEAFDNGVWVKVNSSVVGGQLSPKGDLSAFKLVEDSTTDLHYIVSNQMNIANATSYSMSCIVKANGRNWVKMTSWSGHSVFYDLTNATTGTVSGGATGTIKALPNGFYRLTMNYTSAATVEKFFIYLADADNSTTYTGDGTSGLYIFAAQLEQGSYPTSYIPTSGSATTRSAETCNNAGDVNTFNDSEGVLMFEGSFLSKTSSPNRRITISDGTTSNRILIQNVGSISNRLQFYTIVNNATSTDFATDLSDITSFNKIVFKYKTNNFSVWINGFEVLTNTSGITFPDGTLTELAFDGGDGSNDFYGNTKQIQYFDTALNDTDLEELTSWRSFNEMARDLQYTII